MITIQRKSEPERAILVALNPRDTEREIVEEHLSELEELALTAGASAVLKIIQTRPSADPAYYIGKGKADELALLVELNKIDLVIFDDDLTPVQVRNLEKLLNKKIIDRSGLILDIFASRAKTREARTQVELAQLQYMLPRLTRAWTHLSKQYGGIGTKGPGETQIETDRRMIRKRISHLKLNLQKIETQRWTQSKNRKNKIRIALAGYTNAGKSTLFNIISGSGVFAEDKLFATLDSTTRTVSIGKNESVLITDTVGFIRKLPAHLVASFNSTLNEVKDADIILHVIDMSHRYFEDHILVVEETLKQMSCFSAVQIKVFNKADLVNDPEKISFIKNRYPDSIIISAVKGINLSDLRSRLLDEIEKSYVQDSVNLEIHDTKTAARIHSIAEVVSTDYSGDKMKIYYRSSRENSDKIKKLADES
ncbi:MAG: GTPase HflX [Ignavibacteriaceae bacterium]